MDIDEVCSIIKKDKKYETLAKNEIKAWLYRCISSRDFNEAARSALDESIRTIRQLNAKMPNYWNDSVGDQEVQDTLATLQKIKKYIS